MKKLIFIIILCLPFYQNSFAEEAHFINFTKVLNNSIPGAQAQKNLKAKFQSESKKFEKQEKNLRNEELEIISQKKTLSPEEYKKKVEALRKKVADLQKKKQESFNNIAKSRRDAKELLLKSLNPILKKYMEDNNIRIVLEKKGVVLGDATLEITDQIIKILNAELPTIKIN